jgi:hypothetical protein
MRVAAITFAALALCAGGAVCAQGEKLANADLETVEVEGSRAELKRKVMSFVSTVTRLDGDLVARWTDNAPVCPIVAADVEAEGEFIRQRLLEIAKDAPLKVGDDKCRPNLFVIVTASAGDFVERWRERDPGLFMARARRHVARSGESEPVRTWHNVMLVPADGGPIIQSIGEPARIKAKDTRIASPAAEGLSAVVVLVDTKSAAGVTLQQLSDYIAMVSFTKPDLSADLGQTATILRLFSLEEQREKGLTEWDVAFLHGIYRQSYTALHQRSAIASRMVRELAPRMTAK